MVKGKHGRTKWGALGSFRDGFPVAMRYVSARPSRGAATHTEATCESMLADFAMWGAMGLEFTHKTDTRALGVDACYTM